jgi:hypothetical protein
MLMMSDVNEAASDAVWAPPEAVLPKRAHLGARLSRLRRLLVAEPVDTPAKRRKSCVAKMDFMMNVVSYEEDANKNASALDIGL